MDAERPGSDLVTRGVARLGAIEPLLYRFPAVDPVSFRRAVTALAGP